jgi:F420-non-reducing hydrogenase small subunit
MAKSKAKAQAKPKLALYWAASCGGCEISFVELGLRLIQASELVDIVFWPGIMDFKYDDVEALKDGEITATFFNGAIRNSESEHIAKLLRSKSQVLIAFGACSHTGGIPGLANFYDKASIFERVYDTAPSVDDDSRGTYPKVKTKVPEGVIEIPKFYEQVKTLAQTVDVDLDRVERAPGGSASRQGSRGRCRRQDQLRRLHAGKGRQQPAGLGVEAPARGGA